MRTPVMVGALYDPERSQVAGEGRLVDHNALLSQQLLELFMPLDPMGIEELKDGLLAARFHWLQINAHLCIKMQTLFHQPSSESAAGSLDGQMTGGRQGVAANNGADWDDRRRKRRDRPLAHDIHDLLLG